LQKSAALRARTGHVTGNLDNGETMATAQFSPHRGENEDPFGFTALDIKAYYMGVTGCSWRDTRSSAMAGHLRPAQKGNHNAVQDAVYQAELFRLTRAHRKKHGS